MSSSPMIDDDAPATLSAAVIGNIIRERIGFDGALMTDDISMGALSGDLREPRRGAPSAPAAISCSTATASLPRWPEIAAGVPELAGEALRRTDAALASARAAGGGRPPRARGALRLAARAGGRGMNEDSARWPGRTCSPSRSRCRRAPTICSSSTSTASRVRSTCCCKLARDQKVDLAKISILALAEQYLAFIEAARRLRLEIAADYLVMAAWLAYLKSRLLLPRGGGGRAERRGACRRARRAAAASGGDARGRPPADGLAAARHRRLSARHAGAAVGQHASRSGTRSLYDLLSAYARAPPARRRHQRAGPRAARCSRCRRRASG